MLNGMEMVSTPDGKMLPLIDFINKNGGGGTVKVVDTLPEASEDNANILFILNNVTEPQNVTLLDAKGVVANMITGASYNFDVSWIDFEQISFEGANKDNGDIWDTTTILSPRADSEFNITSNNGGTTQGVYAFTETGITRKNDPYGHCAINKVTGVSKATFPKLCMCVEYDSNYIWVDLVRNSIIN